MAFFTQERVGRLVRIDTKNSKAFDKSYGQSGFSDFESAARGMAILACKNVDDQAQLFFGAQSEFIKRDRFHQYITLMNDLKQWRLLPFQDPRS